MSHLLLFTRCLLALVFAASAVSKLRGRHAFGEFAESLRDMRLLPSWAVRPIATVVALAEAAVPPLLIPLPFSVLTTAGFVLAGLLLSGFTVAVATVLRRKVSATCRCFGGSTAAPFGRHHVVRNLLLTACAAAGAYASATEAPTTVSAAALAVPFAAVAALIVIRLDDLVALFTPLSTPPRR